MAAELHPGYGPDLAFAHADGHTGFVELAIPTMLEFLREAGIRDGLVADLGCGSGVLARALLDAGYDVLGVDLSPAMVDLARRNAPGARIERASFVDVELPECAAVLSVGQCLGYQFDPRATLPALFQRIGTALRPGGLLAFDLNAPDPAERGHTILHRDEPGWSLIAETTVDTDTLTRRITLFRRDGDAYRRSDERHVVRLHEPATVLSGLRAAGFDARTFHAYGDSPFPAGLVGYHARKPS
ncbi:class I SAM-dependent DNA methyltransferase [Dactylosporangium sp. CS-033363]|uniref:class I SAM-dependent DNA methyltransferase n=1 Tax=Dactylosporangium sp. CS-033363 TaxID=3239935 RepID=UPI003D8E10D8